MENSNVKRVLIPIANGSEDIELITLVDLLRRAGAEVILASANELTITTAHNVKITADCLISEHKDSEFDLIACPGGVPGAENLRDSQILKNLLVKQAGSNKLYAAICASPALILNTHGLLENKKFTGYPNFDPEFEKLSGFDKSQQVVQDGNLITSQGPGTSIKFALKLIEALLGVDKSEEIRAQVLA